MKAKTLGIIGLVLSLFWGALYIWPEYWVNHTYYLDMLKDSKNIYLILLSIVAAAIPVLGVVYFGKNSMQKLLTTFFVGFLVFAVGNVMIKDSLIGNGFLMIVINFGIMLGLMLYFSAGFIVIGDWLRKKLAMLTGNATDVIMNLGLGFGTFLILNYILLMANIYYSPILWAIFAGIGGIIYTQKTILEHNVNILTQTFDKFSIKNNNSISRYIGIILLVCTIMYIYYGLWMSYIPYPTARDANHAYMAIPKMMVNNHGVLWADNMGGYGSAMQTYLGYISYFMGLFASFGSKFWINPDTAGVVMNYMTAIYTILAFLALLQAFAQWFGDDNDDSSKLGFDIGRFGILQWMTSGMGAFLVIVDNKSDFGIMFLGAMGLLFGMRYILSDKDSESDNSDDLNNTKKQSNIYNGYNLTFSAVMFALAIVSKATALFDAMNFGLLLGGLYFGYFVFAGLVFLILCALSYSGLNGVSNFISKGAGNISGIIGILISLFGIQSIIKNIKAMGKILSWLFVLALTMVFLKGPSVLYSSYKTTGAIQSSVIKGIFLGANEVPLPSANGISDPKMCTMGAIGYNKSEQLYMDLKDVKSDGYSEDVGRYVGFGQKSFEGGWFWQNILPNKTCISINSTARYLCNNNTKLNIALAQDMFKSGEYDNDFLSGVINYYSKQKDIQSAASLDQDISKKLTDYTTDKTIYVDSGKIGVPFKLLLPINVSFNRSLQNLSSYYTDIGMFWIFAWIVIIIGFVYSIGRRNKKLLLTTGITLAGWIFWIFVGGGIVWYGIGMISWTIISVAMTFDCMINDEESETKSSNISNRSYIYLMLIIIYGIVQIVLNFSRMSSQNTGGVFTQYKFANGMVNETADTLETKTVKKFPYKAGDIFNLQFPIYNKILGQVNGDFAAGKMDYNILVAGTYSKYFVNNWANIYDDGFLSIAAKWFSDGDQCKSYLRLKDKKMKYMIIDPNIASIVMGGGNSSLMDRFFAKIDSQTNKITQDGAFTMLSKLNSNNYISLYYTNVIPTKYAYILSDAEFSKYFGVTDADKIILTRAKLATLRFWPNEGNELASKTIAILKDRIISGEGYYDIADMFGKIVDKTKVQPVIDKVRASGLSANDIANVSQLSEDEKVVLSQYYGIYQQVKGGSDEAITNTIRQSLQGGSQVIVFEVK